MLEFRFGGLEFLQALFPLRFEPARDETVVRIDRPVAPFSALRRVTRTLDVALELREGGFVIRLELLGGLQRGCKPRRRERRKERPGDGHIDLAATDVQTILPAAVDDVLAGAVIPRRGVPAAVVHSQATPAMSACGDT